MDSHRDDVQLQAVVCCDDLAQYASLLHIVYLNNLNIYITSPPTMGTPSLLDTTLTLSLCRSPLLVAVVPVPIYILGTSNLTAVGSPQNIRET